MNDQDQPRRVLRRPGAPQEPAEPQSPRPPPPGAGRVLRPQGPPDDPDELPPVSLSLADVPDLVARDGDVLVVSYPEVTIPLPAKYASAKVGGSIYTRRLVAGESAREQFERVYSFLSASSERAAWHKLRRLAAEFPSETR